MNEPEEDDDPVGPLLFKPVDREVAFSITEDPLEIWWFSNKIIGA